jgi:hypothetical protein
VILVAAAIITIGHDTGVMGGVSNAKTPREQVIKVVVVPAFDRAGEQGFKVGRNDPCPCGSGQKFKRCKRSIGGSRLTVRV